MAERSGQSSNRRVVVAIVPVGGGCANRPFLRAGGAPCLSSQRTGSSFDWRAVLNGWMVGLRQVGAMVSWKSGWARC
jgi:hypothetical protein